MDTAQIGEKLKQLRVRTNLTQEELASRCDLSKGFISQVERGQTSPSIATLVDILDSLGTNLQEFFQTANNAQVVFKTDDVYAVSNEDAGYTITWLVPNAQKTVMEPIKLQLAAKGRSDNYGPHPGEVLGYVVAGTATLRVGARRWRVRKGECFYFHAEEAYYIENHTQSEVTVLWVTSPPNF